MRIEIDGKLDLDLDLDVGVPLPTSLMTLSATELEALRLRLEDTAAVKPGAAALAILLRGKLHMQSLPSFTVMDAFAKWLATDRLLPPTIDLTLRDDNPVLLEQVLLHRVKQDPTTLPQVVGSAAVLPAASCAPEFLPRPSNGSEFA